MKNAGLTIARRMHPLKVKLKSLGITQRNASDVAFHLADMEDELHRLLRVRHKAAIKQRVTKMDVTKLSDLLESHTLYHFRNFCRAMRHAAANIQSLRRPRNSAPSSTPAKPY